MSGVSKMFPTAVRYDSVELCFYGFLLSSVDILNFSNLPTLQNIIIKMRSHNEVTVVTTGRLLQVPVTVSEGNLSIVALKDVYPEKSGIT